MISITDYDDSDSDTDSECTASDTNSEYTASDTDSEYTSSDTDYQGGDSDSENDDCLAYVDSTLLCPLSQYILAKDTNAVKRLLRKRKKNPTQLRADSRGWTALHVAAFNDEHADCLKLLLRNKDTLRLNLNARTLNKKTALYLACYKGCVKNCRILLESRCNPKVPDINGLTPLHAASKYGHADIVSQLIARGLNSNHVNSYNDETVLHYACKKGNLEVVRVLMRSEQTKINVRNCFNELPLHKACKSGSVEILKILLEADRCLINECDFLSVTPLVVAIENRHVDCVKYLLEQGASANCCSWDRSALLMAAQISDSKILKLVLEETSLVYIREQFMMRVQDTLSDHRTFQSLMSVVIDSSSPECMSLLLGSSIPKGILEAPRIINGYNFSIGYNFLVMYSLLAYLFYVVSQKRYIPDKFDELLELLLKNNITHLYEFTQMVAGKATHILTIRYGHPFTHIFSEPFLDTERDRYLNMLFDYGITTDYCVQFDVHYVDSFPIIDEYIFECFYEPVVWAVKEDKAEFIELLLVNSAILEPSDVWNFLRFQKLVMMERESPQNVVNYLIDLGVILNASNLRLYPFVGTIKYPNLKQLCRQAIRKHLRNGTMEDDLKNFKAKINALPLSDSLKDYLHFKRR